MGQWKDRVKEWAPGNLVFLSTDGAALRFIVVGEPVKLEGKFKGKPQVRIGCPVVTEEGFSLFVTGKRVFRKLAGIEDKFKDHVVTIVRHGEEGDADATYTVTAMKDAEVFKALSKLGKETLTAEALAEAVEAAVEVVNN